MHFTWSHTGSQAELINDGGLTPTTNPRQLSVDLSVFKTVGNLAFLAQAAREARKGPLLAALTYRFETRPLGIFEFAKTEERIEERLALMESTASG